MFLEKKEEKFYLVLADSGMGKTTFMINLYLRYMRNPFKRYHMELLPLGHPRTGERIAGLENKTGTILLLDAFDEDMGAARDYKARMEEIIKMTSDFQVVIITSRTQFFPTDPEIPVETGLYRFGGDKGVHLFYRLYVSPFKGIEIRRFLRRKYPFYFWKKRRKAARIVEKSPNLMVRPMLLANIEDLLMRPEPYRFSYEIYEEMVTRWLKR
ncbi:MAG: leucine-rich repeat domain-containing protein, partial [bacterium]|nr:leucine-rich repeat domain-containing protein [bacterium]